MLSTSWLRNPPSAWPPSQVERNRRRTFAFRAAIRSRPRLELLEARTLLSAVSFSPPANYAAGQYPFSVAVADFNRDGKPDVAVANADSNNVSILLGNGDGTFGTAQNFLVGQGGGARRVVVADFNSDGKPDLAVANLISNTVSVLVGNGDGTFQAAQNFSPGGNPFGLAVGDFNGDGMADVAVANAGSNTVSVLLGNGDGTLQPAESFPTGVGPVSVAVGDFNGDTKLDLAVANFTGASGNGTVSVLLGNGDGTFQSGGNFGVGVGPWSVVASDFNSDGKPDLAVVNNRDNTVSVLMGNGDGTFQIAQNFGVGVGPSSVAVGDFSGDGKPDLVEAGGSNYVSVLVGNGDGTFQTAQNFAGPGSDSVAVGDFNGDSRPDLAVANGGGSFVSVLLNQFVTTTAVSGPASSTYAQTVNYTASVTSGSIKATSGTITFLDGNIAISPALAVNANGQASFNIATLNAGSHTITASYSGAPGGAGTTAFASSTGTIGLVINPALLSATAVNYNATAGAPFTGTIATFINPDPFGTAASYTALIDWGDGTMSTGTITGTGTLTVSGSHTYADPAIDAASVQISHKLGNTTTATVYPTANVTSLGLDVQHGLTGGIGFWHGKNGQALINSFNGGSNATALSTWLSTSFANLYGAGAGPNNLTGESNSLFQN